MGLGLTIVYATMRNHGGNVVVSSEPGGGTTVSLFLPVFNQILPVVRNRDGSRARICGVLLVEEDDPAPRDRQNHA